MKNVLIKSENNMYHFEGVKEFKKRFNYFTFKLKEGSKMFVPMKSIIYIAVKEAKQ